MKRHLGLHDLRRMSHHHVIKHTQLLELFVNIKITFVSFFSILMFVALGVGLFLGIEWAAASLETAADNAYRTSNFHDYEIAFYYGLTPSDMDDLKNLDGVTDVEGCYNAYSTFRIDGEGYVAKLQSVTSHIDIPTCTEGTLPTVQGEVAIDSVFAAKHGIAVGDKITLDADPGTASGSDSGGTASSSGATADNAAATGSGSASAIGTDTDGNGLELILGPRTLVVTALVTAPEYLSVQSATRGAANRGSGAVDCYLLLPTCAFDSAAYDGCFTNVFVRCSSLDDLSTFSKEYENASDTILQSIETLSGKDGKARFDSVRSTMQSTIDDRESQWTSGEQQTADLEQQISDGETQLAQARQAYQDQVDATQEQLDEAYANLVDKQAQYDENSSVYANNYDSTVEQLNEAQQEVDSARELHDEGQSELDESVDLLAKARSGEMTQEEIDEAIAELNAELTPATGMVISDINDPQIDEAIITAQALIDDEQAQADSGQAQVDDGWDQLNYAGYQLQYARSQLDDGWAQYYAGVDQLNATKADTEAQFAQKESQIADAKEQLADAKTKLETGRTSLDEAQGQLSQLKEYDWMVFSRAQNASVIAAQKYIDVTNRLRYIMASLFVIVGLLVCYSAVARIVREQMVLIGTKKALGLRESEITLSFLAYSALSVIIGVVCGATAAVIIIETILNGSISPDFVMGAYPSYFSFADTLLIGSVELVLILLATWFACRKMLKRQAESLLQGIEPPGTKVRFYERWKLWDRLPLLSQSIVSNFFSDKVRVIGSLIGIAGCTALIVTAVTLDRNVNASFLAQYEDVYSYNAQVVFDNTVEGASDNVAAVLDSTGLKSTPVMRVMVGLQLPSGGLTSALLVVPEDEDSFLTLFHMNDISTGQAITSDQLDDGGVWVSAAYAEHEGAHVGDAIGLRSGTGKIVESTIEGIFEYHLSNHVIVMTPALYKSTFGDAVSNTMLVSLGGTDRNVLMNRLESTPGFFSIVDEYSTAMQRAADFQKISRTLVAVYLALSMLMAFIMLLNINIMFIVEKKRELIVLMINGFSVHEAKRYIYRDNIVITVLGIILGTLFGILMGYLTVNAIEFQTDSYILSPNLLACLAGIFTSALFAFIVNLIALRRIPRLNLTDINRM